MTSASISSQPLRTLAVATESPMAAEVAAKPEVDSRAVPERIVVVIRIVEVRSTVAVVHRWGSAIAIGRTAVPAPGRLIDDGLDERLGKAGFGHGNDVVRAEV